MAESLIQAAHRRSRERMAALRAAGVPLTADERTAAEGSDAWMREGK